MAALACHRVPEKPDQLVDRISLAFHLRLASAVAAWTTTIIVIPQPTVTIGPR
ncbi:hypothetical protein N825_02130 [Skermanella stibiiresistens SB22]|uniref:Uncharacterized protein n=1 Tax=Skermanella stibiiresistens SB22 TaxID=1385369 RepID=W9H9B2_9PROT|nr:hypothetical protein N825_02130 [Skermanella stibiiresistens SB22]